MTQDSVMSKNNILYSIKNSIGTLTFNRPDARNALTFDMYDQLAEICQTLSAKQSDVKALIITGAGNKAFASGTDISLFRDLKSENDALDYERKMDFVFDALERVPIPTIAAIQGACTGGGAAIAACCDIRIANENLKFGFPIAKTLGNCLSAHNLSRLVFLIGAGRTKQLLLTANLINAESALAIGLISNICEDPLQEAVALAERLKGHAPLTMAASKEGLRRLRESVAAVESDDLILSCYTSEDFQEGLDAFLAKRAPAWSGK